MKNKDQRGLPLFDASHNWHLKMKLCAISFLMTFLQMFASSSYAQKNVSLDVKDVSIKRTLREITKATGYKFLYRNGEINTTDKLSLNVEDKDLSNVLDILFKDTDITYTILENQIVLTIKPTIIKASAVQLQASGTVLDENGTPMVGVTVLEKGTTKGTTTDFDGKFSLDVADGATLVLSYLGYKTQEVSASENMSVQMEEDAAGLDEIVVVGYGTQSKKDITGSIISVKSKDIVNVPSLSPETAIAGQLAGVQVQQTTGEPGSSPTVRIRGTGSISAGNTPLYVIDGIPITRNLTSSNFLGGVARRRTSFQPPPINPLATLNPNDIESIEVLKDASSAAIYGSRGGNGVVLVTTKKGVSRDKGVFSFNSYVNIQNVSKKLDLMNSEELIAYTRDSRNNNYLSSVSGANINDPIGEGDRGNTNYEIPNSFLNWDGTNTDWQDLIFRTGTMQSYNMSYASPIKNGTSFYVSGGYFSQNGIIKKSKFDRYTALLNLNSNLTKRLKLDLRLAPVVTNNQRIPSSAPYFARPPGVVYSAVVHSPTLKPYNDDGTINQTDNQSQLGGGTSSASNPLAIIEAIDDKIIQFQNRASLGLSYEILPELTFKTFGASYINLYNQDFYRANSLLFRESTVGEPYAQATSSTEINGLWENTLEWTKNISDHKINALAGYTMQKDEITYKQVLADQFPDDLVKTVSGGQVYGGTSTKEEWSLISALLRVNYSFKDRYLFTGTIRSDKSSRFGKDNQTGYFPSLSIGWRLGKENFMKSLSVVSELKLRFSLGQTGNFNIPNYGSIGLLSPYNYNFSDSVVNGVVQSTISNPDLTWEKSEQLDLGIELGLFKDRVYLITDLYRTVTRDLLLNVAVSSVSGFKTRLKNLGSVENKGLEFVLRTKNLVGEFTWETDLNFSMNKNTVLSLNERNEPIYSGGSAGIRHVTRVGDPIGSYYGYVVEGIYKDQADINNSPEDTQANDPAPGDFKFKDIDGDGKITTDDRTVIGSYFPDFTWGITNRFTFKNIDLSFLIQGVQGNEILNLTSRHMKNGEANYNSYAIENNRWQSAANPGNGAIPRADRQTGNHGNNNRPSSFQVEDGSYVRLRNISLGYTLPEHIFKDVIHDLRIYVTGTNLLTFTNYLGYNPEVSHITSSGLTPGEDYGAYPLTKSWTIGLNINF